MTRLLFLQLQNVAIVGQQFCIIVSAQNVGITVENLQLKNLLLLN